MEARRRSSPRATVALFLARGLPRLAARHRRTAVHLGRFFQAIIDGDAGDIVIRKLQQNSTSSFGNYRLTLLVPIALVFVIYILARPTSWGSRVAAALLRGGARPCAPGLIALLITLTIGFAINDSGVAIPAIGAILAVPAHHRGGVRVLEDEARASAHDPRRRRRR